MLSCTVRPDISAEGLSHTDGIFIRHDEEDICTVRVTHVG